MPACRARHRGAIAHAQLTLGDGVILQAPADTEFGTRGFLCRDPERHVWHVGTYTPRDTEVLLR